MRILLTLVVILFCFLHLSIIAGYTSLLHYAGNSLTMPVIFYWLLVLACGLIAIAGLVSKKIRAKKQVMVFNAVASLVMFAALIWYLSDAPPMDDDYAENDIRIQANGSYRHLDLLNKNETFEALQKLLKSEPPPQVEEVWEKIATYREAIDQLDRFDAICDLPEDKGIDIETPFLSYRSLKTVAEVYRDYFLHEVARGNGTSAAEDVARFYRVTRKGMTDATILFNKIIFISIAEKAMAMAYEAIQDPRCHNETLDLIKKEFIPLKISEYAMEKVYIGEYLLIKNTMQQQLKPDTFLNSVIMSPGGIEQEKPWLPWASHVAYYFSFKPNMSIRDIRHFFDLVIAAQKVQSPDFSAATMYAESYGKQPRFRNMAGWVLNTIGLPNFEHYSRRSAKIKVQSDLLAIAVSKKLGRPLEINDYFTNGPCRHREQNNTLRHPGPDGRYETPDDIVLGN